MEQFTNQAWYILTKDILTLVITVIGLVIGGGGLATWRKQIKGNKEFEIVNSLNYSLLKLREAIKYVRNPAIWPSEMQEAREYSKQKYPDKDISEINKDIQGYVYEMRWTKIANAYTETESHLLGAEVLWGPKITELVRPLNAKITELKIALRQHLQPELRTKDVRELHKIIYDQSNGDEDDDFMKVIKGIIKEITCYVEKKIA